MHSFQLNISASDQSRGEAPWTFERAEALMSLSGGSHLHHLFGGGVHAVSRPFVTVWGAAWRLPPICRSCCGSSSCRDSTGCGSDHAGKGGRPAVVVAAKYLPN
jgi:hypothetical protein